MRACIKDHKIKWIRIFRSSVPLMTNLKLDGYENILIDSMGRTRRAYVLLELSDLSKLVMATRSDMALDAILKG